MKLKFVQDVQAPVDFVFDQISDFARAERAVIARGGKVRRVDTRVSTGPGMKWEADVMVRGRKRTMTFELIDITAPEGFVFDILTGVLHGVTEVDCQQKGENMTQMLVSIELKPLNLRGRLLVQSLRLARGRVKGGTQKRLKSFAKAIGKAYAETR